MNSLKSIACLEEEGIVSFSVCRLFHFETLFLRVVSTYVEHSYWHLIYHRITNNAVSLYIYII